MSASIVRFKEFLFAPSRCFVRKVKPRKTRWMEQENKERKKEGKEQWSNKSLQLLRPMQQNPSAKPPSRSSKRRTQASRPDPKCASSQQCASPSFIRAHRSLKSLQRPRHLRQTPAPLQEIPKPTEPAPRDPRCDTTSARIPRCRFKSHTGVPHEGSSCE